MGVRLFSFSPLFPASPVKISWFLSFLQKGTKSVFESSQMVLIFHIFFSFWSRFSFLVLDKVLSARNCRIAPSTLLFLNFYIFSLNFASYTNFLIIPDNEEPPQLPTLPPGDDMDWDQLDGLT